jgi:hypothetical protein
VDLIRQAHLFPEEWEGKVLVFGAVVLDDFDVHYSPNMQPGSDTTYEIVLRQNSAGEWFLGREWSVNRIHKNPNTRIVCIQPGK